MLQAYVLLERAQLQGFFFVALAFSSPRFEPLLFGWVHLSLLFLLSSTSLVMWPRVVGMAIIESHETLPKPVFVSSGGDYTPIP